MSEFLKRTGRLFASPSLIEGMSRVFDILGNQDFYNEDETPGEADAKSIYSDWAAVGDDIATASENLASNG